MYNINDQKYSFYHELVRSNYLPLRGTTSMRISCREQERSMARFSTSQQHRPESAAHARQTVERVAVDQLSPHSPPRGNVDYDQGKSGFLFLVSVSAKTPRMYQNLPLFRLCSMPGAPIVQHKSVEMNIITKWLMRHEIRRLHKKSPSRMFRWRCYM